MSHADDLAKLPESIELVEAGVLDGGAFKIILSDADNNFDAAKQNIKVIFNMYSIHGGKQLIDGDVLASRYFRNQIYMGVNLQKLDSWVKEVFSIYNMKETKELLDNEMLASIFIFNVSDTSDSVIREIRESESKEKAANIIKAIYAIRDEIKILVSGKVIDKYFITQIFFSEYSNLSAKGSSERIMKNVIRVYELEATKKLIAAKVIEPSYIASSGIDLASIESSIINTARILELKETLFLINEGYLIPAFLINPFSDFKIADNYEMKKSFIMFCYKIFSMRATQELLDANVLNLPDYLKYLSRRFIADKGDLAEAKKDILTMYNKPECQDLIEKNRAFTGGAMHGLFHEKGVPRDVSKMIGDYVSKKDGQSAATTRKAAANESKKQLKDAEDRIHKKRNQ